MIKYLKIEISDVFYLIPINSIITVESGDASENVDLLFSIAGHTATGAAEVLGVQLQASTYDDAAKQKEQVNSIVNAIEDALSTAWSKPFFVLEPKYAITGVAQIQEAWA